MQIPCNSISLLFLLATVSVTNTKTRLQGHRSQVNGSILSTAPGAGKGIPLRRAQHKDEVHLAKPLGNLSYKLQLNENKNQIKDLQVLPWDFSSDEI